MDSANEPWELGRIYLRQCDLAKAKEHLIHNLEDCERRRDGVAFAHGLPVLLRLLAEETEFGQVREWIERLHALIPPGSSLGPAAVDYTLGIAEIYQGRKAEALVLFVSAQQKALVEKNKRIALQAEFGSWSVKSQGGLHEEVHRGLALFLGKIPAEEKELRIAGLLLKTVACREMERPLEASALLDEAEALAQEQMNLFMIANIFYARGVLAEKQGQPEKAVRFLELAQSLSENRSLRHLKTQVDRKLEALRPATGVEGLFLVESADEVSARWDGRKVSFRGQELLVDLLKLFMESKDQGLDKEKIVRRIWKEEYNPLVHDNKIYVTIHRLKRLLKHLEGREPALLKNSHGYRLNPIFFSKGELR